MFGISFFLSKASAYFKIIEFCNHHKHDPKPELTGEDDDDDDSPKDQYEPKRYWSRVMPACNSSFVYALVDPMIFLNGINPSLNDSRWKMVHCSTWSWSVVHLSTFFPVETFWLFKAANYLGIKTLLAVGCKTIANMVRGKNSSEVRTMFTISHDPPGEGLNAPQATESGSATALTN